VLGCVTQFGVCAVMVVVSDEVPDGGIQFSQREDRVWLALPVGEIPRQFGKQLCVEGAEDSLNLASALWSGDRGVDDFKMQVPGGLGQLPTGEKIGRASCRERE